jgi:hypothetical protein
MNDEKTPDQPDATAPVPPDGSVPEPKKKPKPIKLMIGRDTPPVADFIDEDLLRDVQAAAPSTTLACQMLLAVAVQMHDILCDIAEAIEKGQGDEDADEESE